MPGLVKAYDNVESSVRKAAVFCIVALHQLVGEVVLKPHLETLNGSKEPVFKYSLLYRLSPVFLISHSFFKVVAVIR